jgi:hypothetical protein
VAEPEGGEVNRQTFQVAYDKASGPPAVPGPNTRSMDVQTGTYCLRPIDQ